MRLFFSLLLLVASVAVAAPKKTEMQIDEQKIALKKLEQDLAQKRQELAMIETEEKGVLNTISLLDQNLNRTRVYLQELSKSEGMLQQAVVKLVADIETLDAKIDARKTVMKKRIRSLYINGRSSEAEVLYSLLTRKDNPERQIYWVHRVLYQDRDDVEMLQKLLAERDHKKKRQMNHLNELLKLRDKKADEEIGLVQQMNGQEQMLQSLKHDKALRKKALQEYERNQKTMLALIKRLEDRRKKEKPGAKKTESVRVAETKKKAPETKVAEVSVPKPKVQESPAKKGGKCMPLNGPIISSYGMQEHPVLHIMTRNLGVEIRGKRGRAVRAAAEGTVAMVSEIDGRGPSVIIEHEGGVYSVYGHMKSIRVQEGKKVKNCEEIGEVGDIASLNGIKLYFQVSEGTQTVDPLQWLKQK